MGTYGYDKIHTKMVALKLNMKTDKDILDRLASVENRQAYVKRLIREDIAKSAQSPAANSTDEKEE